MTDLEIIEYAIQHALAECRKRKDDRFPPSGDSVMKWFAEGINEAKNLRDSDVL